MNTDIYSDDMNSVMLFLASMYELLEVVKHPVEKLSQGLLDVVHQRYLEAMNYRLAGKYYNFTLCPLIENIRRYYRENGNNLFNQETPDSLKDEDEKILWSIAKVRDVCLAHNRHDPFILDGGKSIKDKHGRNVGNDLSVIKRNNSRMNTVKVFYALERAVIKCLGKKDKEDLYDTLRSRNFINILALQIPFPNGSNLSAFALMHSYISRTLFLYENMGKNNFIRALNSSGLPATKIQEAKEELINFRNTALHDHIPIEKMMHASDISKKLSLAVEIWKSVVPKPNGGSLTYTPYSMLQSLETPITEQQSMIKKHKIVSKEFLLSLEKYHIIDKTHD